MKSLSLNRPTAVFRTIQWVIAIAVVASMVIAWMQSRNILVRGVDELTLFPLLGLVAFAFMWSHYVFGAIRRMMGLGKGATGVYWTISSALVLALIILHPVLLNYSLISEGLGFPPGSYQAVYGNEAPFLMLGMVCLLIFLTFELKRWFRDKTWWKYVEYAQTGAMIGIFVHALMLGQELSLRWFLILWWLYGLLLVWAWVYNYAYDKTQKSEGAGHDK